VTYNVLPPWVLRSTLANVDLRELGPKFLDQATGGLAAPGTPGRRGTLVSDTEVTFLCERPSPQAPRQQRHLPLAEAEGASGALFDLAGTRIDEHTIDLGQVRCKRRLAICEGPEPISEPVDRQAWNVAGLEHDGLADKEVTKCRSGEGGLA